MLKFSKLLLLTALVVFVGLLYAGCDQPDDIVTSDDRAYLTLNPQRLPDNPDGTIYELWVANSTDTVSLGQFGYDFSSRSFDREDGNRFFLDDKIDMYDVILVSVEPTVGDAPGTPASIMLIDFISSQTINLTVPIVDSIWEATIRYNMKSTSDGINFSEDGSSIWFANYEGRTRTMTDTLSILNWDIEFGAYVSDTEFVPSVNIIDIDSSSIITKDTLIVLGLDTVQQTIVRFTPILSYDTSGYFPTLLRIEYETTSSDVFYDNFSQDDFALPNLSEYGWKYKGWVISDAINVAALGEITKPAWEASSLVLAYIEGGLLTTGTFYDIDMPDLDNNPYADISFKDPARVPPYPGEDFLLNLPAPLTSVPNLAGTRGHVFVTMEPDFYTDSTNFPLFVFIGDLPRFGSGATAVSQSYTLFGYMYHNDPYRGFPSIFVSIERL